MTVPVLAVDGELTIYRAAELKPLLLAPDAPPQLDLGGVTEIDTAGVQLLLAAGRAAAAAGRPWRIGSASAAVHEALALIDLGAHFGITAGAGGADDQAGTP